MSAAATPRPWRIGRLGESLWIEGASGSAATDTLPGDRRIVCDLRLYGDEALDAETEMNASLILEAVNAFGGGR